MKRQDTSKKKGDEESQQEAIDKAQTYLPYVIGLGSNLTVLFYVEWSRHLEGNRLPTTALMLAVGALNCIWVFVMPGIVASKGMNLAWKNALMLVAVCFSLASYLDGVMGTCKAIEGRQECFYSYGGAFMLVGAVLNYFFI